MAIKRKFTVNEELIFTSDDTRDLGEEQLRFRRSVAGDPVDDDLDGYPVKVLTTARLAGTGERLTSSTHLSRKECEALRDYLDDVLNNGSPNDELEDEEE